MTDTRLKEKVSLEGVTMDLLLRNSGLLDEREELATAIRVALGTDALADIDDVLPDPDSEDRRGWWGDLDTVEVWNGWGIGCKNWLLTRAKIIGDGEVGSTLARAEAYTREALKWFLDNKVASRIDVKATRVELQRIDVDVTIYRGPLLEINLRYQVLWREEPFIEVAATPGIDVPPFHTNRLIRIPYSNLLLSPSAPVMTRTQTVYTPPAGQLGFSSAAVNRNVNVILIPSQGNVSLSSTAPSAVATGIFKQSPQGNVALSPTAPIVTRTTNVIGITPPTRNLALSPNFYSRTIGSIYSTWDPGINYPAFFRVGYLGSNYISLIDNNLGFAPPSYPEYWSPT